MNVGKARHSRRRSAEDRADDRTRAASGNAARQPSSPVQRVTLGLCTAPCRRHRFHFFPLVFAAFFVVVVIFFYLKFQVVESQLARAGWAGAGVIAWNHLSAPLVVGDWFSEWFLGRAPFPWVLFSPPVFLL